MPPYKSIHGLRTDTKLSLELEHLQTLSALTPPGLAHPLSPSEGGPIELNANNLSIISTWPDGLYLVLAPSVGAPWHHGGLGSGSEHYLVADTLYVIDVENHEVKDLYDATTGLVVQPNGQLPP